MNNKLDVPLQHPGWLAGRIGNIMSKRDEIEVELAKAEALLAKATAELAKAEADLTKAIIRDQAKADAKLENPTVALDTARAHCRRARAYWRLAQIPRDQLRTALAELNDAQQIGRPDKGVAKSIKGAEEGPELGATARPSDRNSSQRSTQSSRRPVRNVGRHHENIRHGKRFIGSFALPLGKYLVPSDEHARRLLARRSVMLLALLLAYLQYYFLDVQLQIAVLPSVISVFQ